MQGSKNPRMPYPMAHDGTPGHRAATTTPCALQADLFLLMTRYGIDRDPNLANSIVKRLDALARHPLFGLLSLQERRTVTRLARIWRGRGDTRESRQISRSAYPARAS